MKKATKKKSKKSLPMFKSGTISEVQRTILLFILLAVAIGTMLYVQGNIDSNFVEQL